MIKAKCSLRGRLNNPVIKQYPELEDLIISPSAEEQKFKSEKKYGYNEITVLPISIDLQEKQIVPTKEIQEVVPDSEYEGLKKVTVGAIPEEYVIPNGEIEISSNGSIDVGGYKTANVNVVPKLQDKSIVPTKETQEVKADEGYELGTVTVNPIPDEYIIPKLQNKTVKPSIREQTIEADNGYDGLNDVTISAIVLQDKSVTPSKEVQNITPDEDYDGLSNVNIEPIPEEYITPTGTIDITENGETDVSGYAKANVDVKYKPRFISFQACALTDLQPEIEQVEASLIETLYNSFLNSEAIEIDLSSWNLSSLTVMYGTFRNNTALERLDLGNINTSQITNTNYMCNGCSALNTLIIRSDGVLPLTNVNALSGTPIASGTGYVYVKDELVETYKSATNWSNYATQIKGISELV